MVRASAQRIDSYLWHQHHHLIYFCSWWLDFIPLFRGL